MKRTAGRKAPLGAGTRVLQKAKAKGGWMNAILDGVLAAGVALSCAAPVPVMVYACDSLYCGAGTSRLLSAAGGLLAGAAAASPLFGMAWLATRKEKEKPAQEPRGEDDSAALHADACASLAAAASKCVAARNSAPSLKDDGFRASL